MKVSALIPFLLSSTAFAAVTRRSPHPVLTSRQAKLSRGLVDVCVALDLDVKLLDILPGGLPFIAGHLDICLCLSVLPDFCKTNSVARNVVRSLGSEASAESFFADLINKQPHKEQCHYPDHCESICDVKNPCGWQCKNGYVPDDANKPSKCICPAPMSECNGSCGSFPRGCSSQAALSKTKRTPTCSAGKTLCGVSGNDKSYECVDITKKESCGGCVVDSPFGQSAIKRGKDCRAIPNVASVECVSGDCLVSSCAKDYTPSSAKDSCVHTHSKRAYADDVIAYLVKVNILAVVDIDSFKSDLMADPNFQNLDKAGQADRVISLLVVKLGPDAIVLVGLKVRLLLI